MHLSGLLYEEQSFGVFLLVTIILGGGGAYLTGRAIATAWRPFRDVAFAALALGAAVRFFHFSLFEGTFWSLQFYLVDAAFCLAFCIAGFRITRRKQMATQYGALAAGSSASNPGDNARF